jgi:hypothetical protein
VFRKHGGFEHEARSFPLTVRGPLKTDLASTFFKVLHCAILECTVEGLQGEDGFRRQVKNFTSDQHYSESKIRGAPFGPIESGKFNHDEALRLIRAMETGDASLVDDAKDIYFLPYALDVRGHCHLCNNAIQRAVESTDEWILLKPLVTAMCYCLGNKMTKVCVLELLSGSEARFRQIVHSWSVDLIEWRWSELEYVMIPLVIIFPELQRVGKDGKWSADTSKQTNEL